MSTPDSTDGRTPHPEQPAEGQDPSERSQSAGRTPHPEDPPAEG